MFFSKLLKWITKIKHTKRLKKLALDKDFVNSSNIRYKKVQKRMRFCKTFPSYI